MASSDKETSAKMPQITDSNIQFLETKIDEMEETLPPLKAFVLPGGHSFNSQCHITRTICRRTERSCIRFWELQPELFNSLVEKYLNRLSDYLFTLSRYWNNKKDVSEVLWLPK